MVILSFRASNGNSVIARESAVVFPGIDLLVVLRRRPQQRQRSARELDSVRFPAGVRPLKRSRSARAETRNQSRARLHEYLTRLLGMDRSHGRSLGARHMDASLR
jgi:hypothetical protein